MANTKFLLALDQGTTSSRAIVFSDAGEIVALAQREFQQHFPQPGWVEHDAEEIWTSQRDVACEAIAKAKLKAPDIAAIGITNQRETVVVWDRSTGRPIHRAIVWQDRRTAAECDQLRSAGREPMVHEKTGLLFDPYFSATKIAWILDHVPDARAAAEAGRLACGTVDSWLIYRLTGGKVHVTDASNASRTLLMNIHTGEWDDDLLDCFRVPRQLLPEIRSSSEIYGEVHVGESLRDSQSASRRDAATCADLAGVPIAGAAGDQQAALFGQTCFEPGLAKNTYGTGCFMLMNTGTQAIDSKNRLLTTVAWNIGGQLEYALEGGVFIGGAIVQWLRDGLGIIKSSADVEKLAQSVPDSGGIYVVPAFAGLGAPHWDPYARGAILGITRGTNAGHIARAAVESIALQVADLADAMHSDAVGAGSGDPRTTNASSALTELRVDGGASVNDGLLQFQSNMMQLPVIRPKVTETTALGAAYLAGLAAGVWKGRSEIAGHWQVDRRFEPHMSADEATTIRERWRDAVQRSLGWAKEKTGY